MLGGETSCNNMVRSKSMAAEITQKSLVEQILSDMFASIEELEEFDGDVLCLCQLKS
jgi:hypothetical protein